jgi:predicted TPR repeat methyltransferase
MDREQYRRDIDQLFKDFWGWLKSLPALWEETKRKFNDLPGTNFRLGEEYYFKGDFSNALIRYRFTVWLAPTYAPAHYRLARCFQILGSPKKAIKHYEMALRLRTNYPEAAFMLAIMKHGKAPGARLPKSLVLEQFDRLAPYYRAYYVDRTGYTGHMATEKGLSDWVGEQLAKGKDRVIQRYDITEIGCGCGITGERLRPYARVLTGVDMSQPMLDHIPQPPEGMAPLYDRLFNEEMHEHLARQPSATADIVVAAGVFNYVGDLAEIVKLAGNLLRPGGMFAFTVERIQTPDANLPVQTAPFEWQPERGTFAHAMPYLKEICQHGGLKLHRMDDIMLYAGVPGYFCMFTKPAGAK